MTDNDPYSLLDENARRVADEQVVHGLLTGYWSDRPEYRAQLVARVGEEISRRTGIDKFFDRSTRWFLMAAAGLLVAATITVAIVTQQPAYADVNTVIARVNSVDQTYFVEFRRLGPLPQVGPAPRIAPPDVARYDGAKLFVHGDRYVLELNPRGGPPMVKGFDGEKQWFVGPRPPNEFVDRLLQQPTEVDETLWSMTVDLAEMLERIRTEYDVAKPVRISRPDGEADLLHFVAIRKSEQSGGAPRIELWANARTGQLTKLICIGIRHRGPFARFELRLTLISTDPLPENWFAARQGESYRTDSQEVGY